MDEHYTVEHTRSLDQTHPGSSNSGIKIQKEGISMQQFSRANHLIKQFKGDTYLSGYGTLTGVGELAKDLGKNAALICDTFPGADEFSSKIQDSLRAAGIEVAGVIEGAAQNAPREDLLRITDQLSRINPHFYISFGGGSTIDASKAAEVLHTLGGDIDDYFGTGLVTRALESSGKKLIPHVAIQTAASSAAHLTKYSNITDLATGQKKLIVDEAIVPPRAVFDYEVTLAAPISLTTDGALDGVSHSLEVLYSAAGKPDNKLIEDVSRETFRLVFGSLPRVLDNPLDRDARAALALATDLGGYAIMLGGTSGAHLTSFSLTDILSHGRACILMNPYYTVFFAPAIQSAINIVGAVCREAGLTEADTTSLNSRAAGEAVAEALRTLEKMVNSPTTLTEVPGFTDAHIERALAAAKNPQLSMKLQNMPVPLTADMVDTYMRPVLEAAKTGDLSIIRNV